MYRYIVICTYMFSFLSDSRPAASSLVLALLELPVAAALCRAWKKRACACDEGLQWQCVCALEGLAWHERRMSLQGPGQHHFGYLAFFLFRSHCSLCQDLATESVSMDLRRTFVQLALESLYVQVLVTGFQDKLCSSRGPVRVRR